MSSKQLENKKNKQYKNNTNKQHENKQVQKNISIINKLNNNYKICEIPNYAEIIETHRREHLEYYLILNRCPEHD